jgi:hypothetical protein
MTKSTDIPKEPIQLNWDDDLHEQHQKEPVDFWGILRAVNEYDRWLSDMLCSCVKNAGSPDEYSMLRMCREKLQELLNK